MCHKFWPRPCDAQVGDRVVRFRLKHGMLSQAQANGSGESYARRQDERDSVRSAYVIQHRGNGVRKLSRDDEVKVSKEPGVILHHVCGFLLHKPPDDRLVEFLRERGDSLGARRSEHARFDEEVVPGVSCRDEFRVDNCEGRDAAKHEVLERLASDGSASQHAHVRALESRLSVVAPYSYLPVVLALVASSRVRHDTREARWRQRCVGA
mmetsp:Transcript_6030/g.13779  ORF Transcript_6030/g.13779 Transcript_6030/m.13779 type:complete len:209 (+) Transcript_6030:372-998(+)